MSAGKLLVDIAHEAFKKIRNRPKAVARRERKQRKEGKSMAVGTTRGTGIGIIGAAPIITIVLERVGLPAECVAEAAAQGCIAASDVALALMTLVGAVIYVVGHIRNNRRKSPGAI